MCELYVAPAPASPQPQLGDEGMGIYGRSPSRASSVGPAMHTPRDLPYPFHDFVIATAPKPARRRQHDPESANQLTSSPGLIMRDRVGYDTPASPRAHHPHSPSSSTRLLLPLPPDELAKHLTRNVQTVLGCKAAMADYVEIDPENGERGFDEEFWDAWCEYQSYAVDRTGMGLGGSEGAGSMVGEEPVRCIRVYHAVKGGM